MAYSKILRVEVTPEFKDWFETLQPKERGQVETRLNQIEYYGHFGDTKNLGDGLSELRWANGRRVYFTRIRDSGGKFILIVLGGIKNAQKKDIKKARLLVGRYAGVDASKRR